MKVMAPQTKEWPPSTEKKPLIMWLLLSGTLSGAICPEEDGDSINTYVITTPYSSSVHPLSKATKETL